MKRIRHILHPTDFSSASGAAFVKAIELAKSNGGDVVLLHVLTPVAPMTGDGYISPTLYEEMSASSRAYATKQLDALVARAKKAGVRAKALLADGIAHERINRAARSSRADLIVMGTHGRTGLAKLFLGSIAGRVVSTAACPVMTVRGK